MLLLVMPNAKIYFLLKKNQYLSLEINILYCISTYYNLCKIYQLYFGLYFKLLYICDINFKIMEDQIKNAEESFQIIARMIEDEKVRFNENGFVYLFWGWLVVASALLQYALFFLNVKQHYLAWFLMVLGFIYMGIYFSTKKMKTVKLPLTGKILSYSWIIIGLNLFAVCFFFPQSAGKWLMFIILLLVSIGSLVSGLSLRFKWMIIGGILCNALAYISLFLNHSYWGALAIFAVIFTNLMPGYILKSKFKKNNV